MVVAEQNTCSIWNTLLNDIRLQTTSWFGEQIPAHRCFIEGKPDLSLDILAIIYLKYALCTLAINHSEGYSEDEKRRNLHIVKEWI